MGNATMQDQPEVGSIWFDDGNLLIIAGNKVFRLYQGILARHTPVIRDMLSIPGAKTVIDEDDRRVLVALGCDMTGCAVVRLLDKPQEVEWFLTACIGEDSSNQFSRDMSALAGILRLATKYQVRFLRKWAVECIELLLGFTPDLNADELLKVMRQEQGRRCIDGMFPLIDIAAMAGVQWLLSLVFWRLQSASLSDILHHLEWTELPEDHKLHYLLCRERARDDAFSVFAVVARLHREGTWHGTTPYGQCMDVFKDALHHEFTRSGLRASNDLDWEGYAARRLCGICKTKYVTVEREVAAEAFLLLQKQMGLPERHELMKQR